MIGEAQFIPFCKKCFAFLLREQKFLELDLLACTPKLAGKILVGENFGVCSLHDEKTFLPLGLFATNAGDRGAGVFSLRGAGVFLGQSRPPLLNTGAAKWKDGSAPRYASKIREPRGNFVFSKHNIFN